MPFEPVGLRRPRQQAPEASHRSTRCDHQGFRARTHDAGAPTCSGPDRPGSPCPMPPQRHYWAMPLGPEPGPGQDRGEQGADHLLPPQQQMRVRPARMASNSARPRCDWAWNKGSDALSRMPAALTAPHTARWSPQVRRRRGPAAYPSMNRGRKPTGLPKQESRNPRICFFCWRLRYGSGLTGWFWTELIERISEDRRSRTCGEVRRRTRSRWC